MVTAIPVYVIEMVQACDSNASTVRIMITGRSTEIVANFNNRFIKDQSFSGKFFSSRWWNKKSPIAIYYLESSSFSFNGVQEAAG